MEAARLLEGSDAFVVIVGVIGDSGKPSITLVGGARPGLPNETAASFLATAKETLSLALEESGWAAENSE